MNRYAITSLALGAWMLQSCASAPRYAPQAAATAANPPAQTASATPAGNLQSENGKYSYVIGLDVGESLSQVDFGLDKSALFQGIEDMLSKDTARVKMSREDRQATMQALVAKIQADRAQKDSVAALETLGKNKSFFETNAKQEGVITTASGLQYKIIKQGEGVMPKVEDEVTAHYSGSFIDGKVFDSSVERGEPANFPLANVIQGWQEMLPLMKVGTKVICWVPPELGYGSEGNQAIPANSILVFEIELLGITLPAPVEPAVVPEATPTAEATPVEPVMEEPKAEPAKPAKKSKK